MCRSGGLLDFRRMIQASKRSARLLGALVCTFAITDLEAAGQRESVKELTKRLMPSLVVVHTLDYAGEVESSGTGFVVASNGVIATSLHAIPQGRTIEVSFSDGRKLGVESVYAFDRPADLALLRVAAKDLPVLPLGDSDALEQGESIVAIGHPRGHTFSVVEGVVSARRDLTLKNMIQLAMPTEQGNSGGPIVDRRGTVYGVVAMKHAFERNLGFAVPINALKPLLAKPNPIPMKRWATIGRLSPKEWKSVFGSRWNQHAGRIYVRTEGTGFGGRSLCISEKKVPQRPYELAVWVKLEDESGAAGLAFESDGKDVHYGFYPTGGNLRLTRFDGPSVWSWTIIETVPSAHYHPGEWNHLKVRVAEDGIECFVNEQPVIRSSDVKLRDGKVGLAKFRDTKAVFRGFQVARNVPSTAFPPEVTGSIREQIDDLAAGAHPEAALIAGLKEHPGATRSVLHDRAEELEKEAEKLRQLAGWVHTKGVEDRLLRELGKKEDQIDLFYCALLLSQNDDPELDIEAYRSLLDTMAEEMHERIPANAGNSQRLEILNNYLFQENGFHGSRGSQYAGRDNSYVNRVLDDREGQPITLSVVYLELARRIGVKGLSGAGLRGHFMVHYQVADKESRLIDVYEGGTQLGVEETRIRLGFENHTPATKRGIIARILRNLINGSPAAEEPDDSVARYYELIVEVEPAADFDRVRRALARWQSGNLEGAKNDLIWLLEHDSAQVNKRRVQDLLMDLERAGPK